MLGYSFGLFWFFFQGFAAQITFAVLELDIFLSNGAAFGVVDFVVVDGENHWLLYGFHSQKSMTFFCSPLVRPKNFRNFLTLCQVVNLLRVGQIDLWGFTLTFRFCNDLCRDLQVRNLAVASMF